MISIRTTVHRWLLVAMLLVTMSTAMTGCVSEGAKTGAPPEDQVFVITRGTAAARTRGEPISAIPSKIHLVAGQSVTVKNEDEAMHYFFDAPIAPGQTFRKTFHRPGTYGYSGILSCSIGEIESLTVVVAER